MYSSAVIGCRFFLQKLCRFAYFTPGISHNENLVDTYPSIGSFSDTGYGLFRRKVEVILFSIIRFSIIGATNLITLAIIGRTSGDIT